MRGGCYEINFQLSYPAVAGSIGDGVPFHEARVELVGEIESFTQGLLQVVAESEPFLSCPFFSSGPNLELESLIRGPLHLCSNQLNRQRKVDFFEVSQIR